MFQANDFDDEHWTAKEKDFYPQEIRKRSAIRCPRLTVQ
jgi:hypothetical protein